MCERDRQTDTHTHIFSDDKRYSLQSNYIDLKAGVRLKSPCFPPVATRPAAGQAESLWDCSSGRWGLQLTTLPAAGQAESLWDRTGGRWGLQLSTEPSAALGSSSSTSDEDNNV